MPQDPITWSDLISVWLTTAAALIAGLLWSTTYEDPAFEARWGRRVVVDPSGDIIVAGEVETEDPRHGRDRDVMLWRYSADGELLWSHQQDFGNPRDVVRALLLAPDGSIVISGGTGIWRGDTGASYGLFDVLLASFSATGELQWFDTLEFADVEMDLGTTLALDDCGGFFVGGTSWEDDEHADRPWHARYMP